MVLQTDLKKLLKILHNVFIKYYLMKFRWITYHRNSVKNLYCISFTGYVIKSYKNGLYLLVKLAICHMFWNNLNTNQFGLVKSLPRDEHDSDLTPYLDLCSNFRKETITILFILQKSVKTIRRYRQQWFIRGFLLSSYWANKLLYLYIIM